MRRLRHPTGAKAVTATLTAVTPAQAGYMRAWAAGGRTGRDAC